MQSSNHDGGSWGQRSFYLMILTFQTFGLSASINVPNAAINNGTLGYVLVYVILFVLLGVPLLYMELIIGQFTGLNSLNVWRVRPCLSHFSYVIIFQQILTLFKDYVIVSFCIHYFLVSFESRVPYYTCGQWATNDCDILVRNYTIYQNCLKTPYPEYAKICEKLTTTFPECQYWRYVVLKRHHIHYGVSILWQLSIPLGVACTIIYLSCFKRKKSMGWFIVAFTIYPKLGYLLFMMGTLLQKGIVMKFEEALDLDWTKFSSEFDLSRMVEQVIYSLGLGSGLAVNLGASCSFRAPCLANAALSVAVAAAFTLLSVCTTAMMSCPYAYKYDNSPMHILKAKMTYLSEKIPRMIREYDHNYYWIIIIFSCHACLGLRSVALVSFNLLEMFAVEYSKVAKYPGLFTFGGVFGLFCITLPFLSQSVQILQAHSYRRFSELISVFVVLTECIVFVLWYGLERFCEDVHFMQGIRPKTYMKLAWMSSSVILLYVFVKQFFSGITATDSQPLLEAVGFWLIILPVCLVVLILIVRLSISAYKKRLLASVELGSAWRPRSEVLQRSRAMFSAQAMTKEYLYRQYHLQAGIVARQKRANTAFQNPIHATL